MFASKRPRSAQHSTAARKNKDPLQRIGTDIAASSRTPSLPRSATDGLLEATRHGSRSPVPERRYSVDAKRTLSRSSSLSQPRVLSGREIDFGAMKKFNETKLKMQADVNEELRNAIDALKKPSRGVTAREYADAATQRTLPGYQPSRKLQCNAKAVISG